MLGVPVVSSPAHTEVLLLSIKSKIFVQDNAATDWLESKGPTQTVTLPAARSGATDVVDGAAKAPAIRA